MPLESMSFYIETAAWFATSPLFLWVWCALITIYTFRWLVRLKWESAKIKSHLKEAMTHIQKYPTSQIFCENFVDLSSQISLLEKIRRPWKEFCQNLIKPQPTEEGSLKSWEKEPQTLKASRPTGEFFNAETLIQPSIDIRFFNAIPTHLTGLGILGTFCGLAAGIYLARSGLSGGKMEEVQLSLAHLLSGASLSFGTSILGIFSSLLFSKLEKATIKSLRTKIEEFNAQLQEFVGLISIEQLTNIQLQQQQLQSKQFQSMVAKLDLIHKDQSIVGEKVLTHVVQEFKTTMIEAAGEEIRSIAIAFRKIHEAINGSRQLLIESTQAACEKTEALSTKTEKALESSFTKLQGDLLETVDLVTSSLKDATKGMTLSIKQSGEYTAAILEEPSRKFLDQVSALNLKTTEAIDHWSSIIDKNQAHSSQLLEAQKELTQIVDPIVKSTANIAFAYKNSQSLHTKSNDAISQISKSVERLEKIQEQIEGRWFDYSHRFEEVDHNLRSIFNQTNSSLLNYTDRVKDFTSDLDKQMSKGILTLAGAVGDLHQVVGHIPEAIKETKI